MDFYSSVSPGLSGTVQSFGDQAYGQWRDDTRSTRQNFGDTQDDTYQRGNQTTRWTSQHFGNQTFTNCQCHAAPHWIHSIGCLNGFSFSPFPRRQVGDGLNLVR